MDKKAKEKFVRELYENMPEHSMCLRCVGWKYDDFKFTFIDNEEEPAKKHVVTLPMALRGFDLLVKAVEEGKLKGLGLSAAYKSDAGEWDACAVDALNQMAIFGEVIYG